MAKRFFRDFWSNLPPILHPCRGSGVGVSWDLLGVVSAHGAVRCTAVHVEGHAYWTVALLLNGKVIQLNRMVLVPMWWVGGSIGGRCRLPIRCLG